MPKTNAATIPTASPILAAVLRPPPPPPPSVGANVDGDVDTGVEVEVEVEADDWVDADDWAAGFEAEDPAEAEAEAEGDTPVVGADGDSDADAALRDDELAGLLLLLPPLPARGGEALCDGGFASLARRVMLNQCEFACMSMSPKTPLDSSTRKNTGSLVTSLAVATAQLVLVRPTTFSASGPFIRYCYYSRAPVMGR